MLKQIVILIMYLAEKNVKFTLESKFNGYIVRFEDGSDVICHEYSYGGEEGLLESYNMPQDEGDVTGYMTAEEVIKRLYVNGIIR